MTIQSGLGQPVTIATGNIKILNAQLQNFIGITGCNINNFQGRWDWRNRERTAGGSRFAIPETSRRCSSVGWLTAETGACGGIQPLDLLNGLPPPLPPCRHFITVRYRH
jgi:hypothetical protein